MYFQKNILYDGVNHCYLIWKLIVDTQWLQEALSIINCATEFIPLYLILVHTSPALFFVVFLSVIVLNLLSQANNTVQVNSVQVPESDIMATNGVIHFVNQVLYPGGIICTRSSCYYALPFVNLPRDAFSELFLLLL